MTLNDMINSLAVGAKSRINITDEIWSGTLDQPEIVDSMGEQYRNIVGVIQTPVSPTVQPVTVRPANLFRSPLFWAVTGLAVAGYVIHKNRLH